MRDPAGVYFPPLQLHFGFWEAPAPPICLRRARPAQRPPLHARLPVYTLSTAKKRGVYAAARGWLSPSVVAPPPPFSAASSTRHLLSPPEVRIRRRAKMKLGIGGGWPPQNRRKKGRGHTRGGGEGAVPGTCVCVSVVLLSRQDRGGVVCCPLLLPGELLQVVLEATWKRTRTSRSGAACSKGRRKAAPRQRREGTGDEGGRKGGEDVRVGKRRGLRPETCRGW